MNTLSQDILKELFIYDGFDLRWKKARANGKIKEGSIAGGIHPNGYRYIKINGCSYRAHRLIYIYHYINIPKGLCIDHINGKKDDNRLDNIRLVTHQENQFNRPTAKGYWKRKDTGKYVASICVDNKAYRLGQYNTEQEARNAYLQAKAIKHIIKER